MRLKRMNQAVDATAPFNPVPHGALLASGSLFVAPFASASCEQHFALSIFTIVSVNIFVLGQSNTAVLPGRVIADAASDTGAAEEAADEMEARAGSMALARCAGAFPEPGRGRTASPRFLRPYKIASPPTPAWP